MAWGKLWKEASDALEAMHKARVLHRDVKPSNMVIIGGALMLNDFDVSCNLDDNSRCKQLHVGTQQFHSPKLTTKWQERDDWLSLVLSFLSFHVSFPFVDKMKVLNETMNSNAAWIPDDMKTRIRKYTS